MKWKRLESITQIKADVIAQFLASPKTAAKRNKTAAPVSESPAIDKSFLVKFSSILLTPLFTNSPFQIVCFATSVFIIGKTNSLVNKNFIKKPPQKIPQRLSLCIQFGIIKPVRFRIVKRNRQIQRAAPQNALAFKGGFRLRPAVVK